MSQPIKNVSIEPAQLSDLDSLVRLERATFDYSCISRRSFMHLIRSTSARCWVAKDGTKLLGYALVLTRSNSLVWRLYSIAVAPEARGKGIGQKLMDELISCARKSQAKALSLEVKSDNKAAIAWYQDCGFETIDVLANYYDDGSDGLKMRFTFDPESP
jgi:ribosomal-protein-alanine acetyltransferase